VLGGDGKIRKLYFCQRHLPDDSVSDCSKEENWVEGKFPETTAKFAVSEHFEP